MRPLICALLLGFLLVAGIQTRACADYALAPVKHKYIMVVPEWSIKRDHQADNETLDVTVNNALLSFVINRYWLADRIDSDSICTGQHMKSTWKYMTKLSKDKPKNLLVELVSIKDTGMPFVAGMWPYDMGQSFKRTLQQGSSMLEMTADEAKELSYGDFADHVRAHTKEVYGELLLLKNGEHGTKKTAKKKKKEIIPGVGM